MYQISTKTETIPFPNQLFYDRAQKLFAVILTNKILSFQQPKELVRHLISEGITLSNTHIHSHAYHGMKLNGYTSLKKNNQTNSPNILFVNFHNTLRLLPTSNHSRDEYYIYNRLYSVWAPVKKGKKKSFLP